MDTDWDQRNDIDFRASSIWASDTQEVMTALSPGSWRYRGPRTWADVAPEVKDEYRKTARSQTKRGAWGPER